MASGSPLRDWERDHADKKALENLNVDVVLQKLLEVKGGRVGKNVNLTEPEVRGLIMKCRDVLMTQPMLLGKYLPL